MKLVVWDSLSEVVAFSVEWCPLSVKNVDVYHNLVREKAYYLMYELLSQLPEETRMHFPLTILHLLLVLVITVTIIERQHYFPTFFQFTSSHVLENSTV